MRSLRTLGACAVLLALALLPTTAGQDVMDLAEDHEYRIAYGDIPSTDAVETPARWNVLEHHDVERAGSITLVLPRGAIEPLLRNAPANATVEQNQVGYNVTFDAADQGTVRLELSYGLIGAVDSFATSFFLPESSHVVLYIHDGAEIKSGSHAATNVLPADGRQMHDYPGVSGTFWFQVGAATPPSPTAGGGFGLLPFAVGIAVGAIVWAVLVQQGIVQKRKRRQTASTAAHKQAASAEDKATLQARKRALMAALKELEVAKMNKEIEPAAYDSLKADFKRQTVTVMRALEDA